MIPTSARFDQSTMTALLEYDPLVQDYCERSTNREPLAIRKVSHASKNPLY